MIASIAEACLDACLNDKAGPTHPSAILYLCVLLLEGQEVLHLRVEHGIQ